MEMQVQLNKEVAFFRSYAYAETSKKCYKTHLQRYLSFCNSIGVPPVPASSVTLAQYAVFLARSLKPQSVQQYLNVIRLLHLENKLPNPLQDNWFLKSTLTGIARLRSSPTVRKSPITPHILLKIHKLLDSSNTFDSMFWAAAVLMFCGLLRKSNLFPDVSLKFDPSKQFIRGDLVFKSDGSLVVFVKYSKTDQFKKSPYQIHFPPSTHPISPVKAISQAFSVCPLPNSAPAFVCDPVGIPVTGTQFVSKLKSCLVEAGIDPHTYSSHSFRRGGATWALQCGIPGEIVQQMGNWRSDCYKIYLDQLPRKCHDLYRQLFINMFPPEK